MYAASFNPLTMRQRIGKKLARLRGYLRARPALLLVVVGLVLPNALCLGAIVAGIGTPVRTTSIVGYMIVALMARGFPTPVVVAAYVAVLVYDVANTIALLFNLSVIDIVHIAVFVWQIDLFKSPLYAVLSVLVVATAAVMLWILLAERETLRKARLLPALLALSIAIVFDYGANTSPHYTFGTALAAGHPFESAAKASGFEDAVLGPAKRNALLVIVEGMGVLAAPEQQALMTAPLRDPALNGRYGVTMGEATYYGSTTAAEMRELCASRSSYTTMLDPEFLAHGADCLPAVLARRGYHTLGVHGFSPKMFDRDQWWPNIGIKDAEFGGEIGPNIPRCGRVFVGACDSAIVKSLKANLEDTSNPQFVYWLTLNTHIPVTPGEHRGTYPCAGGGAFEQPRVCNMANMWRDIFEDVAKLALSADLPPTEILIVGDHAPPLWSRRDRALFVPGKVTWARLAWKGEDSAATH